MAGGKTDSKGIEFGFSLLTLKGSRSSCTAGVEVVDNVDDEFEGPWYAQRIHDLSLEGWVVDSIEAYLEDDIELASERIVYVDFAVDLAQELLERTGYLGESVNLRSMEQSDVWERELRDPMNAERVLDEYNAWAKEWRPWELELNRGLVSNSTHFKPAHFELSTSSFSVRIFPLQWFPKQCLHYGVLADQMASEGWIARRPSGGHNKSSNIIDFFLIF